MEAIYNRSVIVQCSVCNEIITDPVQHCLECSIKSERSYNVVESVEWANCRIEEGQGGDTVSNKMWITNGAQSKYHNKDIEIPEGWYRGRHNCIFNDSEKQKEFSSRVDRVKNGLGVKKAWDEGKFDKRDHSKCGTKGKDNPACRPEVRKKISEAALADGKARAERIKKVKPWEYRNATKKSGS